MSSLPHNTGQFLLGRPVRLNRRDALDLLRRVAADRGTMLALRRLYADEVRKSSLHTMRDDVVLAQLADLIAAGALKVSLVRTPERGVPVEEGATETMTAQLVPEPVEEQEGIWLSASAEAEWLNLSVSAEAEELDLETSHEIDE